MDKFEFMTAVGNPCAGYLLTWKGFSFGVARISEIASGHWDVIELQTGCSVIGAQQPTRKKAITTALDRLSSKGASVVKKRIEAVLTECGDTKVKGKLKTAHCAATEDRLKTLCGRDRGLYCLPVDYFRDAKRPCKRCLRLAKKKKTG
ncbi:MAG: hypothetical protein DRP56_00440 [Planctomycetota bacterium]|nr:MAG: hypothetical protein DRP56_00440 [Planctomycetota bacterium]